MMKRDLQLVGADQMERGDTPGRPSFIYLFHMSTVTLKTFCVGAKRRFYAYFDLSP